MTDDRDTLLDGEEVIEDDLDDVVGDTVGSSDSRRRPSLKAIVITVLALGGVAVLVVAFATRFGVDPGLVASPLIGKPAAPVTLDFMEKEGSLAFSDLEGEIVVVNFWASWCGPCRAEHDALLAANARYRGEGVRFVGVLYQDRVSSAARFLDELGRGAGYEYVVDPDSHAAVDFGVYGVPETFFIDRDGIVRGKIAGPASSALLAATLEEILAAG